MEKEIIEKYFNEYKIKSLLGFDGFYIIEKSNITEIVIDFVSNDFAIDKLSFKTIIFEVEQIAKFLNCHDLFFNILVFETAISTEVLKELKKTKYKIKLICL